MNSLESHRITSQVQLHHKNIHRSTWPTYCSRTVQKTLDGLLFPETKRRLPECLILLQHRLLDKHAHWVLLTGVPSSVKREHYTTPYDQYHADTVFLPSLKSSLSTSKTASCIADLLYPFTPWK